MRGRSKGTVRNDPHENVLRHRQMRCAESSVRNRKGVYDLAGPYIQGSIANLAFRIRTWHLLTTHFPYHPTLGRC